MKFSKLRPWAWAAGISVAAVLGGGAYANAQAPAKTQSNLLKTLNQGIVHSAFYGVAFQDGKGVAVGMKGAIFESADAGATWTAVQHDATDLALLAVDRRGSHTIAVGQSGVVLVEDTAGKWVKIDSGMTDRMFAVSVNSNGLAVAGGEFGVLVKSTDGGRTWASTAPDWSAMASEDHFGTGEPMVYATHVTESGVITVAGEYGLILRSEDQGASWRVIRAIDPEAPTLHALYLVEAGQGNSYAVGQAGELLISGDGGESWMKCDTGTELNFLSVTASPSGQVVATGMRVMFRSQNNGMTWDNIDEGDTTTDWYQAVRTEPTSGRIIAVGHSGKIIQIGS